VETQNIDVGRHNLYLRNGEAFCNRSRDSLLTFSIFIIASRIVFLTVLDGIGNNLLSTPVQSGMVSGEFSPRHLNVAVSFESCLGSAVISVIKSIRHAFLSVVDMVLT